MNKCKKNNGFSLIEILLVLGVVIALSVVAFITYEKVSGSRQTSQIIENTNLIAAKGRELTANPSIYGENGDLYYDKFIISCFSDDKECFEKSDLKEVYANNIQNNVKYDFNISVSKENNTKIDFSVKGINRSDVCTNAAYKLMKSYKNIAIYSGENFVGYNYYDDEGGEKELTVGEIGEACQNFEKLNADNYEEYKIDVIVYE